MESEILLWCLDFVSSYMSFSIYVIISMIWMFNVEPGEGKKNPIFFFMYMVKRKKWNVTQHRWSQQTQMPGPVSGRWSCTCIPETVKWEEEKRKKSQAEWNVRQIPKISTQTASLARHLHSTFEINCSYLSPKNSVLNTMCPRGRFFFFFFYTISVS